jgi:hypothetical protein
VAELLSYNTRAVRPLECFKSGWELIKDRYWFFLGITVVAMLLASLVPLGILMGPMMCGMYLVYFQHMRGRPVEFGLLFKGFDWFVESLIATLIQLGAMFLTMLPFMALFFWAALVFFPRVQRAGGNPPEPKTMFAMIAIMGGISLILTVVVLLLSLLFTFAYPLITDRNLKGLEAVRMSFKAACANAGGLLGLLGLNVLLGFVGMIFCYVGVFFVLPLTFAALATAYRQVFDLASENLAPLQA